MSRIIENGRFQVNDPFVSFNEKWKLSSNGCWEWIGVANRYGNFSSQAMGFRDGISAHRASWILHKGPIPRSMFVLHRCDNKQCVNPEHLFLGTQSDNMKDKFLKGRQSPHLPPVLTGQNNKSAKLCEEDVRRMRELRNSGLTFVELGKQFGVSNTTAHRIVTGANWKHV
jgi:hypothetical protein